MTARLCAFVIWSLVAASAVFWGLRLGVKAPALPAGTSVVEMSAAAQGDLVRLFGAAPVQTAATVAAPAESSRYRLTGVMSPRASASSAAENTARYGLALIAIDGKPPRPYKVGARIDGEMTLQSVSLRSATVGAAGGAASFMLELPPLAPPATGTLPPVSFNVNAPPVLTAASLAPPPQQQPAPMPPQALPATEQPAPNSNETEAAPAPPPTLPRPLRNLPSQR